MNSSTPLGGVLTWQGQTLLGYATSLGSEQNAASSHVSSI
jgi:hypothetical protein